MTLFPFHLFFTHTHNFDERLFNPSGIVNWSPRVSSGSTFTLRRRCKRFCLVEGGKERKRSQMLSGRYIQAHEHGVQREKSTYESWMALWLSCIALLFRADIAGQSYTAGRADRSCALAISARESCDECRPTAQQQPLLISLSNYLFSSFFLFFFSLWERRAQSFVSTSHFGGFGCRVKHSSTLWFCTCAIPSTLRLKAQIRRRRRPPTLFTNFLSVRTRRELDGTSLNWWNHAACCGWPGCMTFGLVVSSTSSSCLWCRELLLITSLRDEFSVIVASLSERDWAAVPYEDLTSLAQRCYYLLQGRGLLLYQLWS